MDTEEKISLFKETVIPDCKQLLMFIRQQDKPALELLMHRLKGVMLFLKATEAIQFIEEIENNYLQFDRLLPSAEALYALVISDDFIDRYLRHS